ncbi:MAG: hypothetical protein ACKV0T_14660 [Planctomycetales bacterium]
MRINGRLLLLAVVMGLFMRVWTVNDRVRHPRGSRSLSAPAQPWTPRHTTTLAPPVAAVPVSFPAARPAPVAATTSVTWTRENAPIPLPAGLVAGEYRVVSDRGKVAHLVIAAEDSANTESLPGGAEFFVMPQAGTRWYFIRLQDDSATNLKQSHSDDTASVTGDNSSLPGQTADEAAFDAAGDSIPAMPHRKFDFSGQIATESPAPWQEATRPAPPELPSAF